MVLFSRRVALAAALSLAAVAAPAHADTIVAPIAFAGVDAPGAQFGILGNIAASDTTFQFVVAASEFTGIAAGSQINSIGFRFAGQPFLDAAAVASYSRYDIQIGAAANGPTALSSNFAANMGEDTVLARAGALTIPAGTFVDLAGDGPNPFYDIAFTTPYTYGGGDLAVTLRFDPAFDNGGIPVDAFTPDSRINTVSAIGNINATTGTVGILNAPVTRFGFEAAAGAVPEPATWAMMIGGVALTGSTLRRRQRQAVAA